jgi:hypothetical protein
MDDYGRVGKGKETPTLQLQKEIRNRLPLMDTIPSAAIL